MILGKKIKELREEHGYTQRTLADKLNIGYSTLAMYETGKRDPDTTTLAQIAAFFSVSTDYLLGISSTRSPMLSPDELELLHHYRKMQKDQKDVVRKVAEAISPDDAVPLAAAK